MKINEMKSSYSAQVQSLWAKKQSLTRALKEQEKDGSVSSFDRVELSKELKKVDAEYKAAQKGMESVMMMETAIQNGEASRRQAKAMEKAAKMMSKMMEIYRRIASGGRVPPEDENALMSYSKELYMAAKAAALLQKDKEHKKYETLLDEEDKSDESGEGESVDAVGGETGMEAAGLEAAGEASAPA